MRISTNVNIKNPNFRHQNAIYRHRAAARHTFHLVGSPMASQKPNNNSTENSATKSSRHSSPYLPYTAHLLTYS